MRLRVDGGNAGTIFVLVVDDAGFTGQAVTVGLVVADGLDKDKIVRVLFGRRVFR